MALWCGAAAAGGAGSRREVASSGGVHDPLLVLPQEVGVCSFFAGCNLWLQLGKNGEGRHSLGDWD